MKLTIFYVSRVKHNYTKLLTASENTLKIKVILHWIFFEISHMSVVVCKQKFCMKIRLHNTFKTTNVMMLINTILENLTNFYKYYKKVSPLKQPKDSKDTNI